MVSSHPGLSSALEEHQSLAVSSLEPEIIPLPKWHNIEGIFHGRAGLFCRYLIPVLVIPFKLHVQIKDLPISGTDGKGQMHRTSSVCPSSISDSR